MGSFGGENVIEEEISYLLKSSSRILSREQAVADITYVCWDILRNRLSSSSAMTGPLIHARGISMAPGMTIPISIFMYLRDRIVAASRGNGCSWKFDRDEKDIPALNHCNGTPSILRARSGSVILTRDEQRRKVRTDGSLHCGARIVVDRRARQGGMDTWI